MFHLRHTLLLKDFAVARATDAQSRSALFAARAKPPSLNNTSSPERVPHDGIFMAPENSVTTGCPDPSACRFAIAQTGGVAWYRPPKLPRAPSNSSAKLCSPSSPTTYDRSKIRAPPFTDRPPQATSGPGNLADTVCVRPLLCR